jgi:hypothetical protein
MHSRRPGDTGYQGNAAGETQQASPSRLTRIERLRAELAEKRDNVAYLQDLYSLLFEGTPLSTAQALVWLKRFDVMIIKAALERTQEWLSEYEATELVSKSQTEVLKYASGCMYKMQAESEAGR